MPWVVGIDEAGYGPNLGPLVQAAVCLHLPDDDPAGWDALKAVVRRAHEPADGRLLIDDSKKVYTRGGLAALERGVWSAFGVAPATVDQMAFAFAPNAIGELAAEAWYVPDGAVPVAAWETHTGAEFRGGNALAAVVQPTRFNRVVDEYTSKAVVLALGLVELAAAVYRQLPPDGAPLVLACDKMGGRNYYAGLVSQAFPDGWVVAEVESAGESRYRVERLDRPVTVTFRPRADGDGVAVALASMLCKYLREVCMLQFNRFWATHVPGLAPTAGYPQDAKRYYAAIQPAMEKLGLTTDQVWRKK
jgi:ribonuclease HII